MLLTLGAAGATVLVMLGLLLVPAIDACRGDPRGIVTCLRGIANDKFDLGVEPGPTSPLANPPIAAEAPAAVEAAPALVADTPSARPASESTRSLVPQVAEKPATPEPTPPQVIVAPLVAAAPDMPPVAEVAEASAPEDPPDAGAAPTIALAEVIEPADVPSFVPPLPVIAVDGVPPDLQSDRKVAAAAPDLPSPADLVPAFTLPDAPDLPTTPPPDLIVAAATPADSAPAPELPSPPELLVAAAPPADPAPDFVLPVTPELPTSPPPDLTIAAVDPVIPEPATPPAAAVLAPSIDAVEIEGDGNFIAGSGPAGAIMRLYVDGIPAGVSPVEGGRWLVEGAGLLTEAHQTLKVEALDPLTGKLIGEATVEFERPVAPAAEVPPPVEEPESVEQPVAAPVMPAIEPEAAPEPPQAAIEPPETEAEPADVAQPNAAELQPAVIPEIAPVVPTAESPSVTILKPSAEPVITILQTGKPSNDAVVTLGAATPTSPAIIAHFTLPTPEVAADVIVLRAMPIGDPGAGRFVSGKAIIRRGDTLWDIAHRYYGHGIRYRTILRANRDLIARPGKIYPGQVFDLPLVYDD